MSSELVARSLGLPSLPPPWSMLTEQLPWVTMLWPSWAPAIGKARPRALETARAPLLYPTSCRGSGQQHPDLDPPGWRLSDKTKATYTDTGVTREMAGLSESQSIGRVPTTPYLCKDNESQMPPDTAESLSHKTQKQKLAKRKQEKADNIQQEKPRNRRLRHLRGMAREMAAERHLQERESSWKLKYDSRTEDINRRGRRWS